MRASYWLAVVLLVGCSHTEVAPTESQDHPPFDTGSWPRQLTFNPFDDRHPSWLPDGSGIVYSTERGDQDGDPSVQGLRDRCIAALPAEGGSQLWRVCEQDGRHADSVDVFETPSVAPDGRLVYIHTTSGKLQVKSNLPRIELAGDRDLSHGRVLRTLPFVANTGKFHSYGWTYRWLSNDQIIYLGVYKFYQGSSFMPDTFFTGLEVMSLQLAGDTTAALDAVPGTDWASSVAVGDDSASIYYTIGGDSLVYRRHLASGVVDTVHNFGFGRVARDVSVRGNTLAAIVGDSVIWGFEAGHNDWIQRDEGGGLSVVDLTDGTEVHYSLAPSWLFRHPEISPDGKLLVVERQPFAFPVRDAVSGYNAVNHRADLWLFSLEAGPLAP